MQDQKSTHESEFQRFQARKNAELQEVQQHLENTNADLSRLRDRYSREIGIGDRTSRQDITSICKSLDINGALLTNIVFTPAHSREGERYYSQIDHLLIADSGIAVIENKYWSGLVFDGVHPRDRISQLKSVFENLELNVHEGEVLQVRNSSTDLRADETHKCKSQWLKLEIRDSPHAQAQKQATRVRQLLNSRMSRSIGWIDTCVYYSYKNATVHHAPNFNKTRTAIVSSTEGLKTFIRKTMHKKNVGIDIADAVNALSADAGDVVGLGKWRGHWADKLS